tara:strand:- start:2051 stop:2227 length:177 start_codon:yes stop_codon:yes gene_type:complete
LNEGPFDQLSVGSQRLKRLLVTHFFDRFSTNGSVALSAGIEDRLDLTKLAVSLMQLIS